MKLFGRQNSVHVEITLIHAKMELTQSTKKKRRTCVAVRNSEEVRHGDCGVGSGLRASGSSGILEQDKHHHHPKCEVLFARVSTELGWGKLPFSPPHILCKVLSQSFD